ncbi:MAG: MazF family transcriptional regulator [Marinilabiliales bacterium]|nr:MAG: MazF family transcriptional regulator [Marinilabiliales bacterium]
MAIKRGYIYDVDLDPSKGSEINKTRPCLVISNNIFNKGAEMATIIPLTSKNTGKLYPGDVFISKGDGGIRMDSKAKTTQVRSVSKERFSQEYGKVSTPVLNDIISELKTHLNIK